MIGAAIAASNKDNIVIMAGPPYACIICRLGSTPQRSALGVSPPLCFYMLRCIGSTPRILYGTTRPKIPTGIEILLFSFCVTSVLLSPLPADTILPELSTIMTYI